MKKFISVLVFGFLYFSFSSMNNATTSTAHIHKVVIDVDESLMERQLIKDKDGYLVYYGRISSGKENVRFGEELDFEYFNINKVSTILKDFTEIIKTNKEFQSVTTADAKKINVSNMLGNLASNVTGKTTIQFLPNVKLKKSTKKFDTDEYITIKMVFKSPNSSTMNKKHQGNELSFKVKIKITSTNKKGDILWEKEEEIKDFSSVFKSSSIPYDNEAEFFKVSREPRLFHKSTNEPIGDFNSLSLDEIEDCMKFVLNQIVSN